MKLAASIVLSLAILVPLACGGSSASDGDAGDDDGGEKGGNTSGGASGSGGTSSSGRGGESGTTGGTTSGGSPAGGASGTSPSGGDAGTAPNGGFAGAVPTGGAAGAPPTGGSAGAGAMGGAGGSGGSGGGGLECETADDCVMFSDCCSCAAVPKGTSIPGCDLVCITDQCTAQQIGRDEITCAFGRCVVDRSCNHAQATCNSMPETCPSGQVRSVTENGCWGPCLPPTECREVTDCSDCGEAVCVGFSAFVPPATGCVVPEPSCTKGNYCECLDACPQSAAYECVEVDDGVSCYCPVC